MLPEIRRILFCTQLGPNAAYIFRYAFLLAQELGARITALHVVETLTPGQEALVEGYVGPGTLHTLVEREGRSAADRLRRRVELFCAQAAGPAGCGDLVEEIEVVEGNAAEQILAQVASRGIDLVVMGAHARSTLLQNLIGTTAQRVSRRSPVPVLLVQVPEGHQDLTVVGD